MIKSFMLAFFKIANGVCAQTHNLIISRIHIIYGPKSATIEAAGAASYLLCISEALNYT